MNKKEEIEIDFTEDFQRRHVDDSVVTRLPISEDIIVDIIRHNLRASSKEEKETTIEYHSRAEIQLRLIMSPKNARKLKNKLSTVLKENTEGEEEVK